MTVISICLESLVRSACLRMAFSISAFSFSTFCVSMETALPEPGVSVPVMLAAALGIVEVAGDGLLHLGRGVHQPEDDEEGHHGGDEVGVGDLPRAAVVAAVDDFLS